MTTTGHAGFEERRKIIQQRLRALNIYVHGGDPVDDEVDQVENLLNSAPTAEAQKKAVSDWLRDRFEADYNRNVRAVNDVLLPLGRCVSPAFMTGAAFSDLHRQCIAISGAAAAGDDVSSHLTDVVEQIARHYFAPHVRAFMIVRAKRLPYLDLVSHYLDDAAMAFYRRNYFACANALTTAVERLLLQHVGWKFGDPNMHRPDIRAAVAALSPRSGDLWMDGRFETYKNYVLRFIEAYQTPSKNANLSASRLNRAFIQHVNDDGSYYTYDDCVTAFQFFDLYVEFVAVQVGQQLFALVPEDDDEMNQRSRHYWHILLEDWLHGSARSTERSILESNPHFQSETTDSNFLNLFAEGPEQNQMIGAAVMALGLRHPGDVLRFVRDPVDPKLFATLVGSIASIMGVPENPSNPNASPSAE